MTIQQVLESDRKNNEKATLITEKVLSDKSLVKSLFEILKNGNNVQRGTCAEVMKLVSQKKPGFFKPYIKTLLEYINDDVSRVKWGVPETIGNLAEKYPQEVEAAVPKLLINTKEKSTVIRWCAAFGLSEIAKYNINKQAELIKILNDLIRNEKNNGVRNVYIKALKSIESD